MSEEHFWSKLKNANLAKAAEKVSSPSDVRERWGKILLNEGHPSHKQAVAELNAAYERICGGQQQDENGEPVV
jgi:hypothetical protein